MKSIFESSIIPAAGGLWVVIINLLFIIKLMFFDSYLNPITLLILYALLLVGLFLFFYGTKRIIQKS